MDKQELLFKTVFCCMACDGVIDAEEIQFVRELTGKMPVFENIAFPVQETLNRYVSSLNKLHHAFMEEYLEELAQADLSAEDSLWIVKLAIQTIEANNEVEYSEIKFFKKIRKQLKITDEQILGELPGKEDYLLPDIEEKGYQFEFIKPFDEISFAALFDESISH